MLFNNLFIDVPVDKNGIVIQKLDFFKSVDGTEILNPEIHGTMFSIIPLKQNKVCIHFYEKGLLTYIGLFHNGDIVKANTHLIKCKSEQLCDHLDRFENYQIEFLKDLCIMQLEELEHESIFHLWEEDGEQMPLTMTKLRTILATKIVGPGSDINLVNTLTCKQDRLPNACVVNGSLSCSDKLYNDNEFMRIIKEIKPEQLELDLFI